MRDFFEAFVDDKRRFIPAGLVEVPADEMWMIGVLTDEDPGCFNFGATDDSVYGPQSYGVGDQLHFPRRERVRLIENLAFADVMKHAVTGGAGEIVEKNARAGIIRLIEVERGLWTRFHFSISNKPVRRPGSICAKLGGRDLPS